MAQMLASFFRRAGNPEWLFLFKKQTKMVVDENYGENYWSVKLTLSGSIVDVG